VVLTAIFKNKTIRMEKCLDRLGAQVQNLPKIIAGQLSVFFYIKPGKLRLNLPSPKQLKNP
jgi:hypothetical protein